MKPNTLTVVLAHEGLVTHKFTCVDLVQSCFDQIARLDGEVHAFLSLTRESAMREAKAVDEKIARGEKIGILEGIPYSVKDVILVEDGVTTAASRMLEDFVAPYDATVIARLRQSGAIMIGKTNTDAYGHGSSTENSDFGVTRNPWDTSRVAGGSSGGSTASVSANMCIFSLGEDTGGSIRQPASLCSVTGLKTSYGRVSRYGSIAYASSLDTIGPVTKTAEDARIVLQAIAGKDEGDHATFVNSSEKNEVASKSSKSAESIVRVLGIPEEYFAEGTVPAVKEQVMDAVRIYEGLGYTTKKLTLPLTKYTVATYFIIATAETSTNLERLDGIRYGHRASATTSLDEFYKKTRGEGFGPEVKRRIMLGTYVLSAGYFDAYYKKAQRVRTLIRQDFERALEECDVLISPTSPFTAFRIGERINDSLAMFLADSFTTGFSLAGLPTISVPCGFAEGLPVGMQITGRYLDEATVLSVAEDFQRVTDFHKRQPDIMSHE